MSNQPGKNPGFVIDAKLPPRLTLDTFKDYLFGPTLRPPELLTVVGIARPGPRLILESATVQLITWFTNNPVKVAVGVLLLVLFGVIAVFQMPVELTPKVEQQWLSVSTIWPGAGPEEIEREIVYEQEKQLKDIPGMKYIVSSSSNSRARVSMGFDISTDLNEALVKVNSRLQQISEYPETALEPTLRSGTDDTSEIATFNIIPRPPSDQQLANFSAAHPQLAQVIDEVRGLYPPTVQLERLASLAADHPEVGHLLPDVDIIESTRFVEDHVGAAMGRIPGVARVWVWGGKNQEMKVIVDPAKLSVLGLNLTDVRNALRLGNRDAPAGQLNEGKRKFDVRVIGRYTSPEEIRQVVITVVNGSPVYVGDIADVELGFRSTLDTAANHFNTRCLRMGVNKEPGANIFEVMEGVKELRDELNEGVLKARDLLLFQSYDDTEYVKSSMRSVRFNMLLGALLTTLVLLLFLRSGRSTLIIGLAIPVSIIGTFLVLRTLGRSLNVVSMAGMSFAIGMLVDNAVVVLENIYRHYQAGESPMTAARRGTIEVWGATLASTLTTLAVFVPILFVREEAGQLFRDIALAISCGVGLSLIVSVVVIPTAAARVLGDGHRGKGEVAGPHLTNGNGSPASDNGRRGRGREVSRAGWLTPLDKFGTKLSSGIVSVNRWLQSSTRLQIMNVLVFVIGAVVIALYLMPPVEYLPAGNRNSVRGKLAPPPGYNVQQVQAVGDAFYERVRPYVAETATRPPTGNVPRITDYTFGAYMGSGYFSVKSEEPLRARELIPLVQSLTDSIPGVEAYVNQVGLFQDGWGKSSRNIEVHVIGPELDQLVVLAAKLRGRVNELLPEARTSPEPSLEMGKPELRVHPDRIRAAESGLTAADIGFTVDAYIDSAYADKYILNGEEIDLTLAIQQGPEGSVPLEEVPITTSHGDVLPLSALADIELASGLQSIRHINRERAFTINVTPPDGVALATAIQLIEDEIVEPMKASGELGSLYRIGMSGTADKLHDTWGALRMNFLIAVLITYLLMAALFESWSYPLVIMVTLPLAAVGGIVGLRLVGMLTGQLLDIITMLGFVILIGTVVNNAILIVHQALNYMRNESHGPHEAVIRSVSTRIRPIFMTTITTTFGLLPLVVINGAGAELYRGLGSVVLGGLVLSTLFTLFLVPSLFSLMHTVSSRVLNGTMAEPASAVTAPLAPHTEEDTGVRV